MSELFETDALEWLPVRPEMTVGVYGKTLLNEEVKVVLTRVVAGGSFAPHRDAYGHLFYILSGEGVVHVGGREHTAGPGLAIRIPPGEEHSYMNTGSDDLMLISLNLPPAR
jgi:mannose-6-phosphate isomerase-like protein (cupin superfamily)